MPLSPFEIIKKGGAAIINYGKQGLDKIAPDVKQNTDGTFTPTTRGLIKNTVLGLPKETLIVGKDMAQGTARGLATLGQGMISTGESAVTGFKKPISTQLPAPQSEFDRKVMSFMYGTDKPFSVTTEGQDMTRMVGIPEGSKAEKWLAPVVGSLMPILDAVPGGRGGKTLLKQVAPDMLERLVKSGDKNSIRTYLKSIGASDDVVDDLAHNIAKTNDRKVIEAHLNSVKVTDVPKNTKAPLPRELEERRIALEIKEQALRDNPVAQVDQRKLMRKEGDIVDIGNVRNKPVRKMEDIIAETGINDPRKFVDEVANYKKGMAEVSAEKKALRQAIADQRVPRPIDSIVRNTSRDVPGTAKFDNIHDEDLGEVLTFIDRSRIPNAKPSVQNEIAVRRLAERYGVNPNQPNARLANALEKVIEKTPSVKQKILNGFQPKPKTVNRAVDSMSTGEVRSLEKVAEQDRYKTVPDAPNTPTAFPAFDEAVRKTPTPLSKKVGFHDAIRTPENVFRKMGLSKEFDDIRRSHEGYVQELPKNIEKISQWAKQVTPEENTKIFRYLDGEAVDLSAKEAKIADEVKKYLEEWADRLGLPEDKRISHYITHIFDDQLIKKEFDEDLAKLISDKVPGSVYDPFLEKRLGAAGYKQDFVAALDAYTKRATRKVHMDPALSQLSDVAQKLEKSQFDYIKKFADRVNMRPSDFDTAVDNTMKQMLGYKLGARPVAKISRFLRQMTFRGMLGANVGSALRNLSQGVNTYAKLGEKYTAIGYAKIATQGLAEAREVGVLADNFITDRNISAAGKAMEKLDKGLFLMFDTAEKVNRASAYYGAKSKALAQGKSLEEAIEYGKKIVRDTQFQYSAIDTPLALQNDLVKVFLQFLTYPVKQTEFLAGMAKNKEYMGIARYTIGGLAFVYTVGSALGMEPKELIPFSGQITGDHKFGVPPSMKLPVEAAKAALNTPDQYGNARDTEKKLKDVGNAAWGVLPGGIQLKKTLQGRKAVEEGGSFDAAGRQQFPVGGTPAKDVQAYIFGKYANKDAKAYFEKKEGNAPKTEAEKRLEEVKEKNEPRKKELTKIYNDVQSLVNTGREEEANAIIDGLSEEDYEMYKDIRTAKKSAATKEKTEKMYDVVLEVQHWKEKGDMDAVAKIVDSLSDDDYEIYVKAKKKLGY